MTGQKDDTELLQELIEDPSQKSTFSWQDLVKKYPAQFVLIVIGGGLLVISGLFFLRSLQSSQVKIIPAEETQEEEVGEIMVHIAGAVEKPGLYQLPQDARINDILVAAGGLAENADRKWFSKNINLAQKVSDGTKFYIPFVSESEGFELNQADTNQTILRSGLVNINTASQGELEQLPKIGPATAQKIIDYRQQHGQFQSVEELVGVPGVGEKTLDIIRNQISIY